MTCAYRGLLPPQTGAAEWNLSDAIFAFDYNVGASLSSHKQKDISILSAQRLFGRYAPILQSGFISW